MADNEKLPSYFGSRRSSYKSPLKKCTKSKPEITKVKQHLTLREIFLSAKTTPKKDDKIFLSSDSSFKTPEKNDETVLKDVYKDPAISMESPNYHDEIKLDEYNPSVEKPEFPFSSLRETNTEYLIRAPKKPISEKTDFGSLKATQKRLFNSAFSNEYPDTSKSEPAFKKFSHLCVENSQSIKRTGDQLRAAAGLYLPRKYQRLYEIFCACETILSLLYSRKETCYFEKLKSSVERMCGMVFNRKHLAMIVNLFPTAYKIYIGQLTSLQTPESHSTQAQKLIIEPIYESDINLYEPELSTNQISLLINRKSYFREKLLKVVHLHHRDFLSQLGVTIEEEKIKRWHPSFRVEEVPDICEGELPEAQTQITYTAKDMLNLVCYQDEERMINAIKAVSESSNESQVCVIVEPKPVAKVMKNIPMGLLEKIRKKEKEAYQREMLSDKKTEDLLAKLQRLPEMMRCLNNFFISEKKTHLELEKCIDKISYSLHPELPKGVICEHLELMRDKAKSWIDQVCIHGKTYFGIKSNMSVNEAVKIVEEEIVKLKPSYV